MSLFVITKGDHAAAAIVLALVRIVPGVASLIVLRDVATAGQPVLAALVLAPLALVVCLVGVRK